MEEIINLNGVEYIKRSTVKEMENELKGMKEIMKQINQLSLLDKIPTDTTTRHATKRVRTNDSDNAIYKVPPSGQELWEIRMMNENGEFISKNKNRKLKITIKEVFIAQKELSRNTTVKEARELRKKLELNEYIFNRLIFNIQQGAFTKFIKQWNKMTQPVVGEKQIPFETTLKREKRVGCTYNEK